jgi:hypothetical protein
MPAFTGNSGTIFMAPYTENGALVVNSNFSLTSRVRGGSTAIAASTPVEAIAVTGNGSGAQGELYSTFSSGAWSGAIAANSSTRSGNIKITTGGKNYSTGDTVYWQIASSKARITDDVTISATTTAGIDSANEVRVASRKLARVRSWSINIANDVVESTTLGDTARSYLATPGTATGSASILYYRDDGEGDSDNQDIGDLRSMLFTTAGAQRVIMSLGVNSNATNDFVFRAFITSTSMAVNYGEIVAVDINFQLDGAFIDTPAA